MLKWQRNEVAVERLLVITLSNIGDAIMTTPVLEALHELLPQARVDIVADVRSAELFEACPYRGHIYYKHKRDGWRGLLRLIRELRRTHYGLIVDLRTDGLSYLLRGAKRYTKWQAAVAGPHAVERSFAVIRPLWPNEPIPDTLVWLSDTDRAYASNALLQCPGERIVAVAPGANWPGKIWPLEHYRAVLEILRDDFDAVVMLGNERDEVAASGLAASSPRPSLNLAGKTSLRQAAAVLERATVFLGNDSGLGHLAAAVGTPTLTLFGPGEPERYHPWGPHAHWLVAPDDDLRNLAPAVVAARIREMLATAVMDPPPHKATTTH
jgi:ADP-heptose:LPS heptosyltransferase